MKCWCHRILLLFCFLFPSGLFAQTEAETREKADKLFREEQFVAATPLYLQLLSLDPRNTNYNYAYGTCLLYNSDNKEKALRYLNYAVSDPQTDPKAWYYLGKALQLNYQFNEAIKNYSIYLDKAGSKADPVLRTSRQIETCQNGKKLMTTITDLVVSSKTEIGLDKFYRLYDLTNIGGTILVNTEFQSKIDKKRGHVPLVHFPTGAKQIFYSSYGDDDANGLDIYIRRRLPTGGWGDPQRVPGGVNSAYDEDFPYMHPDGQYLYFSSKGHNSMGGYDVFRCRFDADKNTFGPPENMDFAVSSPDDDIFYIVDSLNENAWFASARQSSDNKVYVYKTRVTRVPIQLAVVKGDFKSTISPDSRIRITINDFATGNEIGRFASNERKSYLITFPKGGKYEYVMEVEGNDETYKAVVSIPFLREFKPLKQLIIHEESADGPIIRVIDQFDQEVEDPQGVIAQVLKERSKLEVNEQEFDLDQLDREAENRQILSELGLDKYSLSEVADLLESRVAMLNEEAHYAENKAQRILVQVQKNTQESNSLDKQVRQLTSEANKAASNLEKKDLLEQARALIDKQEALALESRRLLAMYDSLDVEPSHTSENESAVEVEELVSQLRKAVSEDKEDAALKVLRENHAVVQKALNARKNDEQSQLIAQKDSIETELSKIQQERNSYSQSVKTAGDNINNLEAQLESARRKEQEELQRQIDSKKNEMRLLEDQVTFLVQKEEALRNRRELLDQELNLNNSIASNPLPEQALNKETVRKAYLENNSTNSNSLRKYVDQELQKLRENELASSGSDRQKNNLPDYETEKMRILSDESVTPEEKQIAVEKLREQTLTALDERLALLSNDLESDPENETTVHEREMLMQQRRQLQAETEAEAMTDTSREKIMSELAPDHETRALNIRNNDSLDPAEKAKQLLAEEERVLDLIRTQQEDVRKKLDEQPENTTLRERENALERLAQQFEDLTQRQREELDRLNAAEVVDSREAVLKLVFPRYEERLEAIDSNENLTITEKQQQRLSLEENLLETINSEIARTDANSPDPVVRKKADYLEELRAVQEGKVLALREEFTVPEKQAVSREQLMTEVYPEYDRDRERIENNVTLTATARNEALNLLDESLLGKLDRRSQLVEKDLFSHPDDPALLAEKELIDNLVRKAHAEIDSRTDELANLSRQQTQPDPPVATLPERADVLASADPSYEKERQRIQQTSDENERLEQLLELDREMLRTVRERLSERNENTVQDESARREAELLAEIATELEQKITDESQRRVEILVGAIEQGALLEEQVPNYNRDIERAKGDPAAELALIQKTGLQLQAAIREEETATTGNPEIHRARKEVLTQLAEANALRAAALENELARMNDPAGQVSTSELLQSLREDLGLNAKLLQDVPGETSRKELEVRDSLLNLYEQELEKTRSTLPGSEEQRLISDELERVRQHRRAVSVRIGELETLTLQNEEQADELSNSVQDPELLAIRSEKDSLAKLPDHPDNSRERRKTEDALAKLDRRENQRISELVAAELREGSGQNDQLLASLEQTADPSEMQVATYQNKQMSEEVAQLIADAKESEDPAVKRYLLEQARDRQIEANRVLEEIWEQTRIAQLEEQEQVSLQSQTELEARQRQVTISIGEIEYEIERLQKELENAKRKDRESLSRELEEAEETLKSLNAEEARISRELSVRTTDPALAPAAIDEALSYEEEYDLATSESYRDIYAQHNEVQEITQELAQADRQANQLRRKIRFGSVSIGEAEFDALRRLELQRDSLASKLKDAQTILDQQISREQEPMKIQNLLTRGVPPVSKLVAGTALMTLPAAGLEIGEKQVISEIKQTIPVDVKQPSGLVYRVQVGAFSRPIPENTFSEFNPVSGEKLASGITRYMAGYFVSEGQGLEARGRIRGLGYSDAFLVAYCDGERIPIAEARRLSASGACVSKDQETLVLEASQNTAEKLGLQDTGKVQKVSPVSYNEAPGAAKAEAVELRKGLFYTVQIGVYNRPVPHAQLKNISPLITQRLDNGQIRYSSGIFQSVDEARPKRQEAIDRGIRDAFITAYYQGRRITLSEAANLLDRDGPGILEQPGSDGAEITASEPEINSQVDTVAFVSDIREPELYQLISNEKYDRYPREELKRYNTHGSFYYDKNDSLIKSVRVNDPEILTGIRKWPASFDTLQIEPPSEADSGSYTDLHYELRGYIIPGELSDYLLRLNYEKYWERTESGYRLIVYRVQETEVNDVRNAIERLLSAKK